MIINNTIETDDHPEPGTLESGPFAETKEQIGGFYLIEADDLDQAIALAEAMPIPVGSFESRPIAFGPDADHS